MIILSVLESQTLEKKDGSFRDIVVIDTCVLLADPSALSKIDNSDIVLPLTVVEELDGHKTRFDDVGRNARIVINHLEALRKEAGGDLSKELAVNSNSTIRIEINGQRLDLIEKLGLPTAKNDNRIIASSLGLASTGRNVKLISVDTNMRIKAASLGISALDWESYGKVTSTEYTGWQIYEVENDDIIETLFKSHEIGYDMFSEVDEILKDATPGSYGVLRCLKKSILIRFTSTSIESIASSRKPWGLVAKSKEQNFALDMLNNEECKVAAITGPAGTGKTILTLASALEQTFESRSKRFDRVMVIRPVIAIGRQDIGYLPGTKEEKLGNWFEAIVDTMVALGENVSYESASKTLDLWITSNRLVYEPITYLRGRSLQKTFIIVDEAQNLEPSSLKTILTRVGEGSKIVFLGDTSQIDNVYVSPNTNALSVLVEKFRGVPFFSHIRLEKGERSIIADYAAELL